MPRASVRSEGGAAVAADSAVAMSTASCSDAKVEMLGLPYEAWSLALFVLVGAMAVRLLLPSRRQRLR